MQAKTVFVSIVGTQVFGTLEPFLALHSKAGAMPVKLLYTARTETAARQVAQLIEARAWSEVELLEIPNDLGLENSAPEVVRKIAEAARAEGRRVCFNLDGGMNYLIVASVLELEQFQPLYIQASRYRAVLTDSRDETHHVIRLPGALLPAEILELQGVPYTAALKKNPDEIQELPFDKIIDSGDIKIPDNALKNVQVDNIVFDYIWNSGNNRLTFMKDWRFLAASDDYRERERDLAQWSKDRKRCGDLYDKRVYAVVWDAKSQQRLAEESAAQIKIIHYPRANYQTEGRQEAVATLKKIFEEKPQKVKEKKLDIPKAPDLPPLKDDTLVVCMGTDIYTTLLAISSHAPKHVLLAYSGQSDPVVKEYVERLWTSARALGVESVTPANFQMEGIYADAALPPAEPGKPRIVVNITPGSKGQGAMLARWAMRHGFEVWSIHNKENCASPLLAPEGTAPLPLQIYDPVLIFKLMGRALLSEGSTERDLAFDFPWLDALLAFMRKLSSAGKDINEAFAKGSLVLGQDSLKKIGKHDWLLRLDGNDYYFTKESGGVWFEKLCARAMMNAGANHVRLNLKLDWNEQNRLAIAQKHGSDKGDQQREVDVLAAWGGKMLLLSAKSYDLREGDTRADCVPLGVATTDARNASHNLGKFTLAIVSHMGSTRISPDSRVALLTWRELCDPEKLGEEIKKLALQQSTT